jgi:hypothetical protein
MHQLIEEKIIEELKKGDRNANQLKQSLQVGRDPKFWSVIAYLELNGLIGHYFALTPPSATLTYKLCIVLLPAKNASLKEPPSEVISQDKSAPTPPWKEK